MKNASSAKKRESNNGNSHFNQNRSNAKCDPSRTTTHKNLRKTEKDTTVLTLLPFLTT